MHLLWDKVPERDLIYYSVQITSSLHVILENLCHKT